MKNKGLCNTCINDKKCVFPQKFPVLQCEEFSDHQPKAGKKIKKIKKKLIEISRISLGQYVII